MSLLAEEMAKFNMGADVGEKVSDRLVVNIGVAESMAVSRLRSKERENVVLQIIVL
jgi:hypothetical protein